jgi:heptosyltransferase-2
LIFGGPNEVDIAADIEKFLITNRISNYKNLAGKTSITELIDKISKLDLFITGDSGPMHIAASFNISTISIFGPTNDKETSQWMNRNGVILKKNLKCQPCMKRTCPLKHHNCMALLESQEVLLAVKSLVKIR